MPPPKQEARVTYFNGSLIYNASFFPELPDFPTKMCLVTIAYILELPRHKFCVLLSYTLWTCNGNLLTSVHCMVKACITGFKIYVWAASDALTNLEKFSLCILEGT